MATYAGIPERYDGPSLSEVLTSRRISAGVGIGLIGGAVLAAPLVLYDWLRVAHSALELPAAVTAWLFGLDHFVQNGYRVWPFIVGALCLVGAAVAGNRRLGRRLDRPPPEGWVFVTASVLLTALGALVDAAG